MDTGTALPVRKRHYRRQGGTTSTERQLQRLKAIAEAAKLFACSQDLPAVLDCVARQVARLLSCTCTVQLTLDESYGLPMHAYADPSAIGLQLPAADALAGATMLSAPLLAHGRAIGMIDVVMPGSPERDVAAEHRFLQDLAAYAALSIDNAYRYTVQQHMLQEVRAVVGGQSPDRMLNLVVQDLKGPLSEIKSNLLLLFRTIGGAQSVDVIRANRLLRGTEEALAQIETQIGILLGAPATQQGTTLIESLDLAVLTRLLANLYQQTTERHKLVVSVSEDDLSGQWSRTQIEQVIGTLIVNAITYSPAGGTVQISLSRDASEDRAWAMLVVADKGIGIPSTDLPHIAKRRYRAQNVGAIPGTGLGLVRVREIVARQGGLLSMASVPGVGTTVTVRLPLPDVR